MNRGPATAPAVLAVLVLALAAAACWIETAERAEQERSQVGPGLEARVRAMLDSSAAGWNGGDLDAFMSVYLPTARTTYVGGTGVRIGYGAIRLRYAPLFAVGADRDSLRFEDLRVRSISDDVAVGVATWVLHDTTGVTGSGPFTLVLRQTDDGWRIVHDHSSSWPREEEPAGDAEPEDAGSEVGAEGGAASEGGTDVDEGGASP